jgi:Protein of unknown function (Hypoth_ymh)
VEGQDVTGASKSVQRSAIALAEGVYARTRNPFNHGDPADVNEQSVLDNLATTSVMAGSAYESTSERCS